MFDNKDERDYALCLNEDGTIKSVYRSKLVKYCKQHIVEFILIPIDDPRQYVLYQSPIKKFDELHLTFDAYMTSYDRNIVDDEREIPIYELIHNYDIVCEDMFDFAKFMQSMIMLYTIPDKFQFNDDDFLNSFNITIESAYIDYLRTDGRRVSQRLADVSGTIRQQFSLSEFIAAVENAVCGNKKSQYMLYPTDVKYSTFVINVAESRWSLEEIDIDKPDSIGAEFISSNYLFGVFSSITDTLSFIPYEHIIEISLLSSRDIELCAISKHDHQSDGRTLAQYLCDEVGYDTAETQLTIRSIDIGDLTNYFELFYIINGLVYSITDFIMLMLSCERILGIFNIYNTVIHGNLIEYMLFQASAQIGHGKKALYSFICEDIHMINSNERSYYDRFIEETRELSDGIIPERFAGCSNGILTESPCALPF